MPRKIGRPSDVEGSGKKVTIQDDLGSALVQELVAQVREIEETVSATVTLADTETARIVLGRWRYDKWIKDIAIGNLQEHDLGDGDTDIRIMYVDAADAKLIPAETPGTSATEIFALKGFDTANWAGPDYLWAEEFKQGTNTVLKTGGADVVIPAGKLVYLEVVNNENATDIQISATLILAPTDYMKLDPRGMTDPYFARMRARRRANRTE